MILLSPHYWLCQFIALEGLNSGVPTRTTPTLTPTTLRNIEQIFTEPERHENEAGFVPPLVHSIGNNQYVSVSDADIYNSKSQNIWQASLSQSSSDSNSTRPTPPATPKSGLVTSTPRRNMGGRKPVKDLNISPEEEERRRIRRERNKAAAARCRKRRVDHTNALIEETENLEAKKQALQAELQELQGMKEELEYVLQSHRLHSQCNLQGNRPISPPDIKPFDLAHFNRESSDRVKTEMVNDSDDIFCLPAAKRLMLNPMAPHPKPNRPNSLNVTAPSSKLVHEVAGVAITTPSTGIQFNFDSLMLGGTGLTPVSGPLVPNCSTQQRNIPVTIADLASPENCNPPKLVSL